jgi:hypothetical protein
MRYNLLIYFTFMNNKIHKLAFYAWKVQNVNSIKYRKVVPVHAIRVNERVETQVCAFLTSTLEVNGKVRGQVTLT